MAGRKPVQERDHGTRACFLRGPGPGTGPGCKCRKCSAAHYTYNTGRERAIIRGQWQPFTDAEPVREHIRSLTAAGLTEKNVADLAGVAQGSVFHLMHGTKGSPPGRKIRREAAAKLLAIRAVADAIPAASVMPSAGTVRRLQALVAIGWPMSWLASRLGMKRSNLWALMRGTQVRAATAAAVRELYGELWGTPPAQGTPREQSVSRQAVAFAARRGWAPAMAWDDDAIDDPAATPASGWRRSARSA
jgi:hypothetical protein